MFDRKVVKKKTGTPDSPTVSMVSDVITSQFQVYNVCITVHFTSYVLVNILLYINFLAQFWKGTSKYV